MAADNPVPSLILIRQLGSRTRARDPFFQHDGAHDAASSVSMSAQKNCSEEVAKNKATSARVHPTHEPRTKKMKAFGDGALSNFHFPKVPPGGRRGSHRNALPLQGSPGRASCLRSVALSIFGGRTIRPRSAARPARLTGLFAALKWGAALPAAGVCSAVQLRAQQEERSRAE